MGRRARSAPTATQGLAGRQTGRQAGRQAGQRRYERRVRHRRLPCSDPTFAQRRAGRGGAARSRTGLRTPLPSSSTARLGERLGQRRLAGRRKTWARHSDGRMQRPGRAPRQTWRRRAGGSGAGQSPGGPPADVAVQSWWTRPGRALGGRSGAALEAAGQGTDGDRARRSGGPVGATFDGRARNAPGPSRSAERDGAGLARWMGWARGVDGHSSDVDARESARSGPPCDRPNARARQPSLNPAALAVAGTNRAHVGGGAVDRTPCVAVPLHGTRRSAQQTGVRWRGRVGGASCAGRSTKRARRWPGNALEERPYQQRQRMRAGAAPDAGGSSARCGRGRRTRAGARRGHGKHGARLQAHRRMALGSLSAKR